MDDLILIDPFKVVCPVGSGRRRAGLSASARGRLPSSPLDSLPAEAGWSRSGVWDTDGARRPDSTHAPGPTRMCAP